MFALLAAIQFLTRIPIPIRVDDREDLLARSTMYFPIVGLIIGLLVSPIAYALTFFVPDYVGAVITVIVWLAVTGAIHMDGLLDSADGLLSHRNREQMLEIMKDSRIGAMGAIVAVFYLLLKVVLVFAMFDLFNGVWPYILLVLVPIYSRWIMTASIVFWPYARNEHGTGGLFQKANARHFMISTLIMFVTTTALLILNASSLLEMVIIWLSFCLISLGFGILFSYYCFRRLGGMTGDTYGALNELTELVLLFAIVMSGGLL